MWHSPFALGMGEVANSEVVKQVERKCYNSSTDIELKDNLSTLPSALIGLSALVQN